MTEALLLLRPARRRPTTPASRPGRSTRSASPASRASSISWPAASPRASGAARPSTRCPTACRPTPSWAPSSPSIASTRPSTRRSPSARSSPLGDYAARSLCASCAAAMQNAGRASAPAARAHDRAASAASTTPPSSGSSPPGEPGRPMPSSPSREKATEFPPRTGRRYVERGGRTRTSSSATAAIARITSARSPHACWFPSTTTASDIEAYSVLCVFGRMALKVFGIHRRPSVDASQAAGGRDRAHLAVPSRGGRLAAALGPRRVDPRPGVPVRAVLPALRLQRGALPGPRQEDQGEAKANRGPGPRR